MSCTQSMQRMLSKWLLISGLLVLSLLFSACAVPQESSSSSGGSSTGAVSTTESAGTTAGQSLVGAFDVGPGGCPQCYDPNARSAGYVWITKLWSPLALWDSTGTKLIPELAESWEPLTDDATVWAVHLRDGLLWSDGEPLTTGDIYFYFKLFGNPDFAGPLGLTRVEYLEGGDAYFNGEADEISGLQIVDDTTIEFHLIEPDPLFPERRLPGLFLEAAEHHFSQWEPAALSTGPQWKEWRPSSGPFEWSNYVQDQFTEATANPNYWRGEPKLAKITNRYFESESTAIIALQAGEIDFTYVSGDVVSTLDGIPNLTTVSGPSFVSNFIAFNFREPAFEDLRVRQAILHAIDRGKIIDTLYAGAAQQLNCLFSQPEYNSADLISYGYDPEKAKQLLAEAGWDAATAPQWELVTYYSDQLSQNVMQTIQQQLAEVGINVVPRAVDVPTFNTFFDQGNDWAIAYIGQGHFSGPLNMVGRWHMEGRPDAVGDCKNAHGCYPGIEELTAAIDLYTTSLDAGERTAAAQEACQIMNEQLPDAYLWVTERYAAVDSAVQNFIWSPLPAGGPYYDQAELWETVK